MIEATFRPIDEWPGDHKDPVRSPFDSTWSATLDLLHRELRQLKAEQIVIQIALREDQIRIDGWPRSGATPTHPGVILAFNSKHGPLKYSTAKFRTWHDNVRAIALGLEALRKVDRYGITKRGEQYSGWKALPAGGDTEITEIERGRALIEDHRGVNAALRATHPDHGGAPADFRAVQAARSEEI